MTTLTYTGRLVTTTCWCGIGMALPESLYSEATQNHREIYCPLGHTWIVPGETEAEKFKRLYNRERDQAFALRAERDQTEARLRATKGVVTKLRKRVVAGACPFGCKRHFANVERHVATVHPGALFDGETPTDT